MGKIKLLLFIIAATVYTTAANAQKQSDKQRASREEMAEKQAQHIATDLALDDKTSRKFTETYIKYKSELWAIAPKCDKRKKNAPENEEQAEQNMRQRFERSQKILDIRTKYYKEFSKFMTQKQIEKMYEKERKMMQRLKQRHCKGKPGKPGNKDKRPTNTKTAK